MTIKGGYYIKARCIADSWIANSSPVIRETWDYLLREANYADKKYNGYIIKRGQLFRTYQDIIEALHWKVGFRKHYYTKDAMKHAMKALTKASMITPAKTPRGVIITICNYDRYQNPKNYEHPSEDSTNTLRTPQQRPTINKNVKNLKNEKNNNPPIPPKETDVEVRAIFKYWNSLDGPVTHKSIDGFIEPINARLKVYSPEEIMVSMSNYDKILQGDQYIWTYRYTLTAFLERKTNNIDRFATHNKPFENFLHDSKNQKEERDPFEEIG